MLFGQTFSQGAEGSMVAARWTTALAPLNASLQRDDFESRQILQPRVVGCCDKSAIIDFLPIIGRRSMNSSSCDAESSSTSWLPIRPAAPVITTRIAESPQ